MFNFEMVVVNGAIGKGHRVVVMLSLEFWWSIVFCFSNLEKQFQTLFLLEGDLKFVPPNLNLLLIGYNCSALDLRLCQCCPRKFRGTWLICSSVFLGGLRFQLLFSWSFCLFVVYCFDWVKSSKALTMPIYLRFRSCWYGKCYRYRW